MTPRQQTLLYAIALAAGLAVLYAIGIHNQLVFDDARLTDGTILGQYGSLWPLKPRLLSYGSFVWLQSILGEGWWKQRVFNIGLHIATALMLYAFVMQLLQRTEWDASSSAPSQLRSSLRAAARLGVALWAFNPVAVYAVAYLIQRSIVMATLFVVLASWSYVRGLTSGKLRWHLLAFACYVLAVASKEHAVTAILLAVPLFVFFRRPGLRRVLGVSLAAGLLLSAVAAILYSRYGSIIGTVFDETSRAFAAQLEQQRPGITRQLFPLSIINQAGLFFQYGYLWLLPYVNWMSIDIRPIFPLTLWSWDLAGALAWLAALALGARWLLRRSDAWGLVGLCLLMPCLLFVTEFTTVWLQDPFVLYRSYLWSIPIPVLIALPLVGFPRKTLYACFCLVLALFAALSFDRINSLQNAASAWEDASAKIDRRAPANAVGRWRPLINLGAESLEQGNYDEALRLFSQAEALGEPMGSARFNMGVSLQQLRQYAKALDNFAAAEAKGFTEGALYYQRGETQYALGRFAEAFASFSQSLQHPQVAEAEQFTRLRQAEAAVASNNFDAAIASYQTLLQKAPDNQRYQVGLSMAHIGKKDFAAAMNILNPAIAKRPTGPAYYARALAHVYQGNRADGAHDLELAIRAEPNNPMYRNLQRQMSVPAPESAAKTATKP
ncbi:MAG: tetratricopeptide repeat protein [Rhodoferax sp.]